MRKIKTKEEIIATCEKEFKDKGPDKFYTAGCVNWKGRLKTKEPYTEIIAEFILKKIELFKGIETFTRNKSYNSHHSGKIINHPNKKENEKRIEIEIYNQSKEKGAYDYTGEIIDYEIPLKEKNSDAKGEIDLLSYRQKDQTAFILELKRPDNKKETMLRCVLECYTYMKILDFNKLINDYKKDYPKLSNCKRIIAAPLVFKDSIPYKEYNENRPFLKLLMKSLEIETFYIEKKGNNYVIFKDDCSLCS